MSLRNFNAPSSDALHNTPVGNGGGLDSFHTKQPEDIAPNNTPKIVGALAVVLMIGAAGVALYASAGKSTQPKPVVAASNLPAPPPAPVAMTPAPDANMPASTPPVTTQTAAPAPAAPVKTASVARHKNTNADTKADTASNDAASARMAADSSQVTNQPQQQAAVAAPSPSGVATNNTQSGVAVPQGATTASDIPATAAQDQQAGATPAPAQAPAQSAGQINQ